MADQRTPKAQSTDEAPADSMRGAMISATLAGASGRPLSLRGVLRPVIALGEGGLRGRALSIAVGERGEDGRVRAIDVHRRNPVEIERIDLTAAQTAFDALPPSDDSDRPPLFFLPLSWSTARNPRARQRLLRLAAAAQMKLRTIAICEISGIEPGTPPSVLRETVGALRPIFRGVLAATRGDRETLQLTAGCGFTGASIEARLLGDDERTVLRNVLTLQTVGPSILVHAVRSMHGLAALKASGVSWASLEIAPPTPEAESR